MEAKAAIAEKKLAHVKDIINMHVEQNGGKKVEVS